MVPLFCFLYYPSSYHPALLADGFAIRRMECKRWEIEVGNHGLSPSHPPLHLLGSAFNLIPLGIPDWVNPPPTCCLTYHEKVLPRKLVVGYKKAFNCHLPAIM